MSINNSKNSSYCYKVQIPNTLLGNEQVHKTKLKLNQVRTLCPINQLYRYKQWIYLK